MVDSTIPRVRMRRLARLGRSRPTGTPFRAFRRAVRFATPGLAGAPSLACALASRPRAASRRPGGGALMESTIYGLRDQETSFATTGTSATLSPSGQLEMTMPSPVAAAR